jgi:hypothetical protein
MARPRKAETRVHQINLRFTAPELIRIHRHAAITGKTLTEFGRSVLLRRPRKRKRGAQPTLIAWADETIAEWHALGMQLNDIARLMNSRDALPPDVLPDRLAQLRTLMKASCAPLLADDAVLVSYTLAPAVRHHLRKVGVNLGQIARRFEQLGFVPPIVLIRLLTRIRAILNGDRPPHAA